MNNMIPFDGLFGSSFIDRFFDDVPTIYKDYVASPKTDIEDLKDHYEITCDMPGFTKDEVQVKYENGVLSIFAKKENRSEEKNDGKHYIRKERGVIGFSRQFSVSGIKEDGIKASLKDGVLSISLPKEEEKKVEASHRIEIE